MKIVPCRLKMKIKQLILLAIIAIQTTVLVAQENLTVRPWTFGELEKIEKKIESKAYGQALNILQRALPKVQDVAYEKAILLRTYAQIFALKNDYASASKYLKQCIALKALPANQQAEAKQNFMQLQMAITAKRANPTKRRSTDKKASKRVSKRVKTNVAQLEAMVKRSNSKKPDDWMRVANAYTQNKQYGKAIAPLKKAIKLSRGNVPHSWHKMLLGLYQHQKNHKASIKVLERLLVWFPKEKKYWEQLAFTHQYVQDYRSSIAVHELRLKKGYLVKPTQLLSLASLYLHEGLPQRAAELLEKQINSGKLKKTVKNMQMLGNAWAQAKEYKKSVDALQTVAIASKDGKTHFQMGQMLIEIRQWNKAQQQFHSALQKGGIEAGDAWLMISHSYRELNKIEKARQALVNASKYNKSKQTALQWLSYMDKEG